MLLQLYSELLLGSEGAFGLGNGYYITRGIRLNNKIQPLEDAISDINKWCVFWSAHSICINYNRTNHSACEIASEPYNMPQLDNVWINYMAEWVSDPHFLLSFSFFWKGKVVEYDGADAQENRCSRACLTLNKRSSSASWIYNTHKHILKYHLYLPIYNTICRIVRN